MTMESRKAVQLIACVILILSEAFEKCKSDQLGKQPHIIFILADDLGWDDVSFHGSSQIPTPNIDSLAHDGVILTNYYVSPVCTPTRSAIMTGKHPIHTGMQGVILADEPWGLGLEETTIAQHLKSLGYSTHAVGKWHLGFFAEEYTPTRRGFDSFLGFYSGRGDYFTHEESSDDFIGYDFRKNLKPHKAVFGQYSTDIFTEEAKMIIETHNASQPLFLYLAHQAVHAAFYKGLTQEAPYEYYKRFPHIKTKGRRLYAAMASALDDSVGIISQTLRDAGLYDNTIIIFSTDNGGPTSGTGQGDHACNYPLRGGKFTLWEGGVRGTAFVNSPLIKKPKRINDHLMHVCDWLPTLYRVGGGDPESLTGLDGFDQWDSLSGNAPSPRKEVLHNIDPHFRTSAIRIGDYKLIYGPMAKRLSGWYRPEGEPSNEPVHNSFAVKCPSKPLNASTNCDFTDDNMPCLYNIRDDPCEFNNIADWNQDIVDRMSARLEKYRKSAVEPRNQPADPQSDPRLHGNVWQPWITLSQDNTSSHKDNTRTQVHQP